MVYPQNIINIQESVFCFDNMLCLWKPQFPSNLGRSMQDSFTVTHIGYLISVD